MIKVFTKDGNYIQYQLPDLTSIYPLHVKIGDQIIYDLPKIVLLDKIKDRVNKYIGNLKTAKKVVDFIGFYVSMQASS